MNRKGRRIDNEKWVDAHVKECEGVEAAKGLNECLMDGAG